MLFWLCAAAAAGAQPWPAGSQALLDLARQQPHFRQAEALSPQFLPTADGQSFAAVRRPAGRAPQKWLVTLHGTAGFATQELIVWAPAVAGREIGHIALQWWFGRNSGGKDYYAPNEVYRELDTLLPKLGIQPGQAMLAGFSRGSANLFAVAALDRNRGHRRFGLYVASSGGLAADFPPNRMFLSGEMGPAPFTGSRWVTACGERDPVPQRDGCAALRRSAETVQRLGGEIVLRIEDPRGGHGALNTDPDNARKVLDLFLKGG